MNWLAAISAGWRALLGQLRDRWENPERLLHQAILDLEDELELLGHRLTQAERWGTATCSTPGGWEKESEQLRRALRTMEEQLRTARQRQTLLLARLARASAEARLAAELEDDGHDNARAQLARLEARASWAEALGAARRRIRDWTGEVAEGNE